MVDRRRQGLLRKDVRYLSLYSWACDWIDPVERRELLPASLLQVSGNESIRIGRLAIWTKLGAQLPEYPWGASGRMGNGDELVVTR
jgi:hypothetical protein